MKGRLGKMIIIGGILLLLLPAGVRWSFADWTYSLDEARWHGILRHLGNPSLSGLDPSGKTLETKVDKFYAGASGYKQLLLPVCLFIKNHLPGVFPYPGQVVKGRDGWYFLGDDYSDAIRDTKGLTNFTTAELYRIRRNIIRMGHFCMDHHTMLYLAVAPEKSDVYGCYLPVVKTGKPTKFDQVKACFPAGGVRFVDLGSEFASSAGKRIYYKTDSHWNNEGLFLGCQALTNAIRKDLPDLPVLTRDRYSVDSVHFHKGDLLAMISIDQPERMVTFNPLFHSEARPVKRKYTVPKGYTLDPELYERRFINKAGKYKVLVIHDSFFAFMPDFLKENFRKSVFLWSYFDSKKIGIEKPDVVVYEIAERELDVLLNEHVIL